MAVGVQSGTAAESARRGRLADTVALVTGAGQGIGEAIARMMHAQGAAVVFSDVDGDRAAAAAATCGASAELLDVASEHDWDRVAANVKQRFGHLDILVNNAGIEIISAIEAMSPTDWRRIMAVNLDGVFLGCRSMMPLLVKGGKRRHGGASVVNISSIAGIVGFAGQVGYNTSKAGVRHLSKSLAIEWARRRLGIRVNSVHPGCIRTPMLDSAAARWAAEGSMLQAGEKDIHVAIANLHPVGRIGRVEDIAFGAVYLASDEAGFVTGTELIIDGGWTAQ